MIVFSELMNEEIKEDMNEPRSSAHLDYLYLKSNAGPLFKAKEEEG